MKRGAQKFKPTKSERRERRKAPKMKVSGRSVFVIQRIKAKKKL